MLFVDSYIILVVPRDFMPLYSNVNHCSLHCIILTSLFIKMEVKNIFGYRTKDFYFYVAGKTEVMFTEK